MRPILIMILTFRLQAALPQTTTEPIPDSCRVMFDFIRIDSSHSSFISIHKCTIDSLLPYLHNCNPPYHFPSGYSDKSFDLTAPRDLTYIVFESSDNSLGIRFDDSAHKTIVDISYDFDGSYKTFFFNGLKTGKQIASQVELNGQTCWLFKNWDDSYAGTIFLENNTFISYFTKEAARQKELQRVISHFKWE